MFNHETNSKIVLRRCAGGRADRRGSAIVLVLVSIVLMAILAATLLQVARFERIPKPASNIDIVVESVISEIANQMTDDLLDNDGNMFNVRLNTANGGNGGGDESWDYPWTNIGRQPNGSPGLFGREAEYIDGSTVSVFGGAFDDTWLATNAPDFRSAAQISAGSLATGTDPTYGMWRKLTSLNGMYLYGNGGSSDLSTLQEPDERPVNSMTNVLTRDMNISANHISLVDADGDGIGDSRWEWAPLRQIGTTRYVMAVRVVDLSGRVDLNVAMGRPATANNSALRGTNPTDINGHQFAAEIGFAQGINPNTAKEEWRELLNYRLTGQTAATRTSDPIASGQGTFYDRDQVTPGFPSRLHYWTRGAALLKTNFQRTGQSTTTFNYAANATFTMEDALELLQRNGLNSTNRTTVEEVMPLLARRDGTEEFTFKTNATVTGNNWNQRNFWELDLRKHVSPFTGADDLSRPAREARMRTGRLDVNAAIISPPFYRFLRDRIRDVINANPLTASALLARYPHLTTPEDLANQLTVNIIDYVDRDNQVTIYEGRAGYEALPYITELYTQRLYTVTNVAPPVPPATTDTVTWQAANNTDQGYVIEIGNPHAQFIGGRWVGRPVSLEGVWMKFYDSSNSSYELSAIQGVPDVLEPGEVLYLYRNSRNNANDPDLDDLEDYHTTTGSNNFDRVINVQGPVFPTGGTRIRVGLYAEQEGSGIPADSVSSVAYSACEGLVSLAQLTDTAAAGTFMPGYQGYVQTNYQGVGHGLRMMTVTAAKQSSGNARGFGDNETTLDKPWLNCNTTGIGTPGAAERRITPALADESKVNEPAGFMSLENQQIVWQDNPRERMEWIGDILQIPLIGLNNNAGNDRTLMAEALNNAGLDGNAEGITALLLPYKTGPTATPAERARTIDPNISTFPGGRFGAFNIPHALMLLEQLTTFSPSTDREDGDGQNERLVETVFNPDQDEMLVAGKINLNTATEQTLVRALPYPDLRTREAVARAIIERRESGIEIAQHGMGGLELPGIKYTSSLYEQIGNLQPGYVSGFTGSPSEDGVDNLGVSTATSPRIDWNDYEDTIGSFPAPGGLRDGIIDDREEEIMLGKWLSQVAETRSDVFAAYIVVQGYPAEDFRSGALESARLIVIFSRSGVRQTGDRAVEIGRFRFK